jgi:hypothetical protein
MHSILLSVQPLAAMFDFNLQPHMIAIIVPIAGMIFGGVMAISAMVFKHRQREMWHETARIALERGQPLPPPVGDEVRVNLGVKRERNDIRSGLILLGVGAGLAFFFGGVHEREGMALGAIPGFIGVALILNGLIQAWGGKKNSPPENRPPPS